jgi:hypothetical protein
MAHPRALYAYKGLLFKKSAKTFFNSFTIRVIVLYPAVEQDAELHCALEHLELPRSSRKLGSDFEPVSYVWGDSTRSHTLICEGCDIPITASADKVLRRFRKEAEERRLWIDAICKLENDDPWTEVCLTFHRHKSGGRRREDGSSTENGRDILLGPVSQHPGLVR